MPKLKNPFAKYQVEKVASREGIVTRYFDTLRKTRAKFPYVTDLAKAVAEQITLAEKNTHPEKRPCSASTLLRNKHYKALLLNFMASHPGTDSLNSRSVTDNTAKLLLNALELDVGNLKNENARLRSYVTSLEKRLDERNKLGVAPSKDAVATHKLVDTLDTKYALVCKSLWLVIGHFNNVVTADTDGQRIIDLAASRRKNVIVDADTAAPFFEWLRVNKDIGQ